MTPAASAAPVHVIPTPWGRFSLFSYFIDAPEPAIVDTGVTGSPTHGIVPALERLGRRVEEIRWILLTHGHVDHIGGAHELWELTGGRAKVVIGRRDAPLLRSRRAHVDEYLQGRGRYLHDPAGEAQQVAVIEAAISGELEPTRLVSDGDRLSLGGEISLRVVDVPGHSAGAVAYVVEGQGDVFVGDSVERYGAASAFPSFGDPDAYRDSLLRLRDEVRPKRLFLGHPYRNADGQPGEVALDRAGAAVAIQESLANEARIRAAVSAHPAAASDSPYAPFERVAQALGYTFDPALEPSPFFTTMHGYATTAEH
jgi:glyoxylase-like metal-dependent hydrolase (beta-lactamase superfamily II)